MRLRQVVGRGVEQAPEHAGELRPLDRGGGEGLRPADHEADGVPGAGLRSWRLPTRRPRKLGRRTLGLRRQLPDRQRDRASEGAGMSEEPEKQEDVEWPDPAPEPEREPDEPWAHPDAPE